MKLQYQTLQENEEIEELMVGQDFYDCFNFTHPDNSAYLVVKVFNHQ